VAEQCALGEMALVDAVVEMLVARGMTLKRARRLIATSSLYEVLCKFVPGLQPQRPGPVRRGGQSV
jgi:hypothetical protein